MCRHWGWCGGRGRRTLYAHPRMVSGVFEMRGQVLDIHPSYYTPVVTLVPEDTAVSDALSKKGVHQH